MQMSETSQHSSPVDGLVVPIERITNGPSNHNNVKKSGSIVIGQNGVYGYTDLPPKDFISQGKLIISGLIS